MKRLTPSLVLAIAAIVLSITGAAYAVKKIDGKSIEKASITGSKLKRDTLTGKQIKESKLGEVPVAAEAKNAISATTATRATSADEAGTLGGLTPAEYARKFSVTRTVNSGDSATVPDAVPGLGTLSASCPGGDISYNVTNSSGGDVTAYDSTNGGFLVPPGNQIIALNTNSNFNARSQQWAAEGRFASFLISAQRDGGASCTYRIQGFR